MNNKKKLVAVLLAFLVMFTCMPVISAKAADEKYPTKIRITDVSEQSENKVEIKIPGAEYTIKNVKSKSSNLKAAIIGYQRESRSTKNYYTIGFIAKKAGTYDISYDVMKNNKKQKTINAKVYAYPSPVTVKLDGVKGYYYQGHTESPGYIFDSLTDNIESLTTIRVTYVDKYTKSEEQVVMNYFGIAK